MKLDLNELLQWFGAGFIIVGHVLNAIGPSAYPYNILTFLIGTMFFFAWTLRVKNTPQMAVNVVALCIGSVGVARAFL